MDEKSTHFAVHVYPAIFGIFKIINPLHPAPFQKCSGVDFKNVDGETYTTGLSVGGGWWWGKGGWFQPKNSLCVFVELLFLDSYWYTPE